MPRGTESRVSRFNAVSDAFSRGAAIGQRGREARAEDDRQERRLRMMEEQHQAEMASPELDTAVRERKKRLLEGELDMEIEMKRAALSRFVEADKAFTEFETGLQQIDWGASDAGTKYEMLSRQYLPKVLQDPNTLRKWEALDRVTKQGRAFANKKSLEAMTLSAMEEAAQVAPELALDPPKNQDGSINMTEFAERLRERRKEKFRSDLELRQASAGARRGAAKPTLGAGAKAELDAVADELREVNKQIGEMSGKALTTDPGGVVFGAGDGSKYSGNADRMRALVNRKATLLRQLRAFDSRFESAPLAEDSAPANDEGERPSPVEMPAPADRQAADRRRKPRFHVEVVE